MYQRCLIPPESIPPSTKYEKLFENLPDITQRKVQRGSPLIARETLLKGLIYRNLRGIDRLVELEFELRNNSSIAETLGLPLSRRPPSDELFSEFLRVNPNGYFRNIRKPLVQALINEGVISGNAIALDSCSIEASLKENNPKTSIKEHYEKHHLPSTDKDARLGVTIHFFFTKRIHYLWSFRSDFVNDLELELPLYEITLQANKSEKKLGLSILKEVLQHLSPPIEVVAGDANYDIEGILEHIVEQMQTEAITLRSPGNPQNVP